MLHTHRLVLVSTLTCWLASGLPNAHLSLRYWVVTSSDAHAAPRLQEAKERCGGQLWLAHTHTKPVLTDTNTSTIKTIHCNPKSLRQTDREESLYRVTVHCYHSTHITLLAEHVGGWNMRVLKSHHSCWLWVPSHLHKTTHVHARNQPSTHIPSSLFHQMKCHCCQHPQGNTRCPGALCRHALKPHPLMARYYPPDPPVLHITTYTSDVPPPLMKACGCHHTRRVWYTGMCSSPCFHSVCSDFHHEQLWSVS